MAVLKFIACNSYMHILENIMRHKRIYLKNAPRKQYICQSFISVDLDPVKELAAQQESDIFQTLLLSSLF